MEITDITNPSLVEAMETLKIEDTDLSRQLFINAMVNASFIVPAIIDPVPEGNVIPEGTTISLYSMKSKDGKSFLTAFTDMDELKKWPNQDIKQTVINRFQDIKGIILKGDANYQGFIINPFNQNVAINKPLIESLDKKIGNANVKMEKINNEAGAGLTPAENVKEELIADLCSVMSQLAHIEEAYMMQTIRPGTTAPTLIVVVKFEGELRSTFDSVAMTANKHLGKGESIGFMPASDKIASEAVQNLEPFYRR